MSDEMDRYMAEQDAQETERLRRDHFLHQLGATLIWLSSVVFAFLVGYSMNRHIGRVTAILSTVGIVVGLRA